MATTTGNKHSTETFAHDKDKGTTGTGTHGTHAGQTGTHAGHTGGHGNQSGQGGQGGNQGNQGIAQTAKDMGGQFVEKAKEMGGQFADKATGVMQGAKKMTENFGERAGDALHSMGSGMKSAGETIRESMPQSGVLGSAGSRIADTLDSTGRYFEEHNFGNIGEDLTGMIRRNPIPALLCAAAIGFLLARASRS